MQECIYLSISQKFMFRGLFFYAIEIAENKQDMFEYPSSLIFNFWKRKGIKQATQSW